MRFFRRKKLYATYIFGVKKYQNLFFSKEDSYQFFDMKNSDSDDIPQTDRSVLREKVSSTVFHRVKRTLPARIMVVINFDRVRNHLVLGT